MSECVSVYQTRCVRMYVSGFGKRIGQNLSEKWALVNIWALGFCISFIMASLGLIDRLLSDTLRMTK